MEDRFEVLCVKTFLKSVNKIKNTYHLNIAADVDHDFVLNKLLFVQSNVSFQVFEFHGQVILNFTV